MRVFARISVGVVGIMCLVLGLAAFAAPERLGEALGVVAQTDLGLNSMRADFGAFFLMAGTACAAALLAGKTAWLWPAALLFLFAAIGRLLGVFMDGAPDGVVTPIIVEIVSTLILINGARTLPKA